MGPDDVIKSVHLLIQELDENQQIDSETAKQALESLETDGVLAAIDEIRPHLPTNEGDAIGDWTN